MTTEFNNRREAFEKKFVIDAELQFKAEVRRNRLIGLWAADLLGKRNGEAEAYAADVVDIEYQRSDDRDVLGKIRTDLVDAGIDIPPQIIDQKLRSFLEMAFEELNLA